MALVAYKSKIEGGGIKCNCIFFIAMSCVNVCWQKKAFLQQSVHLHTYSWTVIKSVTVCIDRSLSESDCHARPFNPPPHPQTGFGRALLYMLQLVESGRKVRKKGFTFQVACLKSLDIWSVQSVSPVVAMWPHADLKNVINHIRT